MKYVALVLLSVLFTACSSAPSRPVFSDFMEIREVQSDDPLTQTFLDKEGEEHRLGDPIISGKQVSRFQVKPSKDETYDLHLTLTGALDARWRRFARSRGRQAALVVDGTVCCIFEVQDPGAPVENQLLVITIPHVADTEEEAAAMDTYLEESRPKKAKAVE